MSQWFYEKNGQQEGPVDEGMLRDKVAAGEITGNNLVWKEGMPDWQPLRASLPDAISGAPALPASPEGTLVPSSDLPLAGSAPIARGTVPSYLWQSIVCVALCCWPLAIPAIFYALKVNPALDRGDLAEATAASENAKKWCIISFALGLVLQLFIFFSVIVGSLAEQ